MEGDEQMQKDQTSATGDNSADFFVNNQLEQPLLAAKKPKAAMREKLNTGLVILVAIFAVFLGYYQLSYNINHPFTFAETPSQIDPNKDCPGGNCDLKAQLAAIAAEQNKDTDGDGLTDWQEINVYHTSPFLADTDGDGIPDGQEVQQGTDPNCPEGQNCFSGDSGMANADTSSVPTFSSVSPTESIQITPAAIRDALKQGGFSDTYLNQFSDAELISIYQEALQSQPSMTQTAAKIGLDLNTNPAASATTTVKINTSTLDSQAANLNIKTIDDLKNLTGAQIRQLMIQSGAPASVLSQATDDQLRTIFLQKLSEKSSASSTPAP